MTYMPNSTHLNEQHPELFSDEVLMLRYCAGDLVAFRELYQRHSAGLYRFIAWRSPRRDWVDEITQDSWVALHKARATYQVSAQFRSFLYQIARNRLLDLVRQHPVLLASEIAHHDRDGDQFEHYAQQHEQDTSEALQTPEHVLITQQTQEQLHKAIASLPSEQKEALVLQQFNDMSLEEIALISEVSVETIKSRLRYAMRKLRLHLHATPTQPSRQEVKL
jgi:RNA polymerase sigma factor (sigma-70 family)